MASVLRNLARSVVAAVAPLAILALLPVYPALAQGPLAAEPVKVSVEVTDEGFKPKVIEVPQGALVELTFVWAHVGYVREEHIMVLQTYKLEWAKIDHEHREATQQFIADRPGKFGFKCDLDCELHDYLQDGELKVQAGGTGAAAARTPTKLTVTPSSTVSTGDPVTLMAVLKDPKGAPVAKAEVDFSLEADFAGAKGQVFLGRARTDANGVAFFDYRPTSAQRDQTLTASFEGMGVYDASKESFQIQVVGTPPAAYEMLPVGLEGAPNIVMLDAGSGSPVLALVGWAYRQWPRVVFMAVVLAVWSTFGLVLYQALNVARHGARGAKGRAPMHSGPD